MQSNMKLPVPVREGRVRWKLLLGKGNKLFVGENEKRKGKKKEKRRKLHQYGVKGLKMVSF